MDWTLIGEAAVALIALASMEIVLGIDNLVLLTILTEKLPPAQQPLARRIGLALALILRIALLFTITVILGLTQTLFELSSLGLFTEWLAEHPEVNEVTGKDLFMLLGGAFLIGKATLEIHEKIEHPSDEGVHPDKKKGSHAAFGAVVTQILIMDVIFSLDSIITAVGMVRGGRPAGGGHAEAAEGAAASGADAATAEASATAATGAGEAAGHLAEGMHGWLGIGVMVTAIVMAVIVMLIFAEWVAAFINRNPTLKMLALSFMILIGVALVADGIGTELNKGYIYFAMGFSLIVEMLNNIIRGRVGKSAKTPDVAAGPA